MNMYVYFRSQIKVIHTCCTRAHRYFHYFLFNLKKKHEYDNYKQKK